MTSRLSTLSLPRRKHRSAQRGVRSDNNNFQPTGGCGYWGGCDALGMPAGGDCKVHGVTAAADSVSAPPCVGYILWAWRPITSSEAEGVTHTRDGGDNFRHSKTKSDITDFVSRYACLQEDVKREGTDLRRREAMV